MKQFRRLIFWCHLLAGSFAGVVVLIMSVTGVLLTYERQILAWADARGVTISRPTPETKRLPVGVLVAAARARKEGVAPSSLTIRADPARPAIVNFGRAGVVLVDPYTGEALGEGARGTRRFFAVVTDWHRWLGASGENRAIARAVTGACNLAFLFLIISGFYLWFPRKWTRKQFRSVAWFRRGLAGKARDFNWHNVVGLWCVIPLFVVALSAVPISYRWAGDLVYRLTGEAPPAARGPQQRQPQGGQPPAAPASLDGLDSLLERAAAQVENWRSISFQLPSELDAPVTFSIDQGDGGQPQKRAQLTLDRATAEVVRWEPFASQTAGRRLRSYLRFAHTGEVWGLLGQTIAGLASLGGAVLVYTGLALAWRRLRAWGARRAAAAPRTSHDPEPSTAQATD